MAKASKDQFDSIIEQERVRRQQRSEDQRLENVLAKQGWGAVDLQRPIANVAKGVTVGTKLQVNCRSRQEPGDLIALHYRTKKHVGWGRVTKCVPRNNATKYKWGVRFDVIELF